MNNNQITHFQRLKQFINSIPEGCTYSTDDLYNAVGRFESSTYWKRSNGQRMYRTATYQTYLKRLGALENVKRGLWRVKQHIPYWFHSKHMNYLMGYGGHTESVNALVVQGFPLELAIKLSIPEDERQNPFKKVEANLGYATIDVDLLKSLYQSASESNKQAMKSKYPELFDKYSKCFNFGNEYKIDSYTFDNGPLMIGKGMAPDGLEHRCLVVSTNYKLIVKDAKLGKNTLIYFEKI